jgi:hypothetical protein
MPKEKRNPRASTGVFGLAGFVVFDLVDIIYEIEHAARGFVEKRLVGVGGQELYAPQGHLQGWWMRHSLNISRNSVRINLNEAAAVDGSAACGFTSAGDAPAPDLVCPMV